MGASAVPQAGTATLVHARFSHLWVHAAVGDEICKLFCGVLRLRDFRSPQPAALGGRAYDEIERGVAHRIVGDFATCDSPSSSAPFGRAGSCSEMEMMSRASSAIETSRSLR